MHRFFVSPTDIHQNLVLLENDQADQVTKVLRLNINDKIIILDNSGWEYEVMIKGITKKKVTGEITSKTFAAINKPIHTSLYISPLKKDNFELILQKCTELGIDTFVPIVCTRTIVNFDNWESKYPRYAKIIQEASEQSTRPIKAVINPAVVFENAILSLPRPSINLIAWEKEKINHIQRTLVDLKNDRSFSQVSIFIGPEGGFTAEEILLASAQGVKTVSLGQRILRSETAAIAACSILIAILESR